MDSIKIILFYLQEENVDGSSEKHRNTKSRAGQETLMLVSRRTQQGTPSELYILDLHTSH